MPFSMLCETVWKSSLQDQGLKIWNVAGDLGHKQIRISGYMTSIRIKCSTSPLLSVCLCTHTYIYTHRCIWTWIHPKEEYILRKTYVSIKNSFTHPTNFWKPLWVLQVSGRERRGGDLTEGSWVSWAVQIVQQGSEIEPQPNATLQTKQKDAWKLCSSRIQRKVSLYYC